MNHYYYYFGTYNFCVKINNHNLPYGILTLTCIHDCHKYLYQRTNANKKCPNQEKYGGILFYTII